MMTAACASESSAERSVPAADAAAVGRLFDDLGLAFREADGDRFEQLFDAERLFTALRNAGLVERMAPQQEVAAIGGLRLGLRASLVQHSELYSYNRFEIRQLRILDEKNELVATVRHWDEEGVSVLRRWWLRKHQRRWRVYDFEDLDSGMRASTVMAVVIASITTPEHARRLQEFMEQIAAVQTAILQESWFEAEAALEELADADLPRPLLAFRSMLEGLVQLSFGRYDGVLESCRNAEALHDDVPLLAYLRAVAYNGLGRHEDARQMAEAYLRELGDCAHAHVALAEALAGLGLTEEALEGYHQALADDSDFMPALHGLGRMLPAERKEEIGPLFGGMRRPRDHFDGLCGTFALDGDSEAIAALVAAYAAIAPDDPDLAYWDAWVRHTRGDHLAAAATVKEAIPRVEDDDEREFFIDLFLGAMLAAGQPLEARREAPDPVYAFRYLAGDLLADGRADELRQLVDAHRADRPDDGWIFFYSGELLELDGQWDEAAEEYRKGLTAAKEDDPAHDSLRSNLVYALYRAGRPLDAYREVGPSREVFSQLASLMAYDPESAALEALIDLHRQADSDDPQLAYQTAKLKFQQEDYSAAAELAATLLSLEEHDRDFWYVDLYLDAMNAAGRLIEGYERAPDLDYAFQHLADALVSEQRAEHLRALVEAHRRRRPDDSWLSYYLGEAAEIEEDWETAITLYRAGLGRGDERNVGAYRYNLVYALFHAGRPLEAYAEVTPARQVFQWLADLTISAGESSDEEKAGRLDRLVEVHRGKDPHDPDLPHWEAEAHWLRGDYGAVIEVLKPLRQRIDASLSGTDWSWSASRAEDRLFLSLVRERAFDEALELAARVSERDDNPWPMARVHAARGDAEQTLIWLERCIENGDSAEAFYEDELLAPALRTEPFQLVREKYPEPSED